MTVPGMGEGRGWQSSAPQERKSPWIRRSILQPPAHSCVPRSQLHADQHSKEKSPVLPVPTEVTLPCYKDIPPLNSHPVPLPSMQLSHVQSHHGGSHHLRLQTPSPKKLGILQKIRKK